jgi:hypothetical protein
VYPNIDTKCPEEVEMEVEKIYLTLFPAGDPQFVKKAFESVILCFSGGYKDFQPIDARYHDLEHTLQGTLCMARLLKGRHFAAAQPVISQHMFELGTMAILLHDTGYLKHKSDSDGTGAKYTLIHVTRSTELAAELLTEQGYSQSDCKAVQNMIRCTGLNVDLKAIPFQSEVEKIVGFMLGTADLLGQMAASDYVSKLPILYNEFDECARFNGGTMGGGGVPFTSADDLMQKTPGFWKFYVIPKINNDFLGLYQFLACDQKENWYIERIQENIDSLQQVVKAA